MKRILAIDGGGIRGVFALQILLRMERMLQEEYGRKDLVLADHFDFFAGASTGAIIAACLCWGRGVQEILRMYVKHGKKMFEPVPWYRPLKRYGVSKYNAKPLSEMLKRLFSEDGEGQVPALLGTERLRKLLMVVVRNHSTGSPWPLTNNPKAKFADRSHPQCNLNIPLYQLVRASTAAPVYFDPEPIRMGDQEYIFVDGSITPYNNPALIAALTVILPCYNLNWETGPDKIRLISIGTMRFPSGLPERARSLWVGYNASHIPAALIQAAATEQDYLCRCLGECVFGEALDREIGAMIDMPMPGQKLFSYVRYNQSYSRDERDQLLARYPGLARLDAIHTIPVLRRMGRAYAEANVRRSHLLD